MRHPSMTDLGQTVESPPVGVDLATAIIAEADPEVIHSAILNAAYDIACERKPADANAFYIGRAHARKELEQAIREQQASTPYTQEADPNLELASQVSKRSLELTKPLRILFSLFGTLAIAGGFAYGANHITYDVAKPTAPYTNLDKAAQAAANADRKKGVEVGLVFGGLLGASGGYMIAEASESREARRRARKIVRKAIV